MGLAGEQQQERPLAILEQGQQALAIVEQQQRALVGSEAPREADHAGLRVEALEDPLHQARAVLALEEVALDAAPDVGQQAFLGALPEGP